MTAQGKITAANAIPGTIVRIIMESDATAALFERKPEYTAARIKRGSVLAEIVKNEGIGGGKRRITTKFGSFTVVGHQTFILAKDGEQAEELAPVQAISFPKAEKIAEEIEKADENPAVAEAMVRPLPEPTFTLSEEEIEENAAAKLADTIRRDEEMAEAAHRERAETERLIQEARDGIAEALNAICALNLPEVDEKRAEAEISKSREMLDGEEPWEAKRHAKRTAERWAHIVRLRKEHADAPEWRKQRITDSLNAYGAVLYPEGTPEYGEYRAKLTKALDEFKRGPVRWRIQFERIGRYTNPEPFDYNSDETPESVEARLRARIRRMLVSREFSIEFEGNRVTIEGGRFGSGTCAPLES